MDKVFDLKNCGGRLLFSHQGTYILGMVTHPHKGLIGCMQWVRGSLFNYLLEIYMELLIKHCNHCLIVKHTIKLVNRSWNDIFFLEELITLPSFINITCNGCRVMRLCFSFWLKEIIFHEFMGGIQPRFESHGGCLGKEPPQWA